MTSYSFVLLTWFYHFFHLSITSWMITWQSALLFINFLKTDRLKFSWQRRLITSSVTVEPLSLISSNMKATETTNKLSTRFTAFSLRSHCFLLPLLFSPRAVIVSRCPVFGLVVCCSVVDGLRHVCRFLSLSCPIFAPRSSCIWITSLSFSVTGDLRLIFWLTVAIDFDSSDFFGFIDHLFFNKILRDRFLAEMQHIRSCLTNLSF